ncbi:MAG: hypothetical protein H6Q89_922 [Myxococcaceae bacterium]|nr:hypothetical protein [Myxococcaceae bacterium]
MQRLSALTFVLLAAVAHGQAGKDDDLSSAFGPPPAPKVFEPEHNVPAPPLPLDVNAELRAKFERDLAAAQKSFEGGDAAAAREQLALVELSAIMLGGPDRVRVHRLQRAAATKLKDPKGIQEADEKWLTACGPNDVPACRATALEAIAAYDGPRVEKIRAADACLTAAEQRPGKPPPACVDAALALYKKAEDSLMVARIELLRALPLASDRKQAKAAKKALARIAALIDDRSALVRRTALETLSRLELAEGAVDDATRDALLAAEAWASTLPPAQRAWARSPAVDAACAAYEKARGAGACRKLEKKLLGDYLFHDFSQEHLGDGELIGHDKLVAVNEHYGVMIQNCLAAEIRSLEDKAAVTYRVKWLVINNGQVDNFHSESTEHEQSRFVQCLREQFGFWRYPRHDGDPQRIQQSFSVKSSTRTWEETEQ